MKKLSLTTLLIIITLGFSSCTQDDNTLLEEPNAEDLLKSFTLQKSVDGNYSMDFKLNQGASAENIRDEKTNTNNIYLYSSDSQSERNMLEDYVIKNGELRIGINDTEKERKTFVTIFDENIVFNRNNQSQYLDTYSITGNGDGTYDLDFTVKENVDVSFVFNEQDNVHEVHLENGEGTGGKDFSRSLTKEEGVTLKFDFVNHIVGESDRSAATVTKVPRGSVDSYNE